MEIWKMSLKTEHHFYTADAEKYGIDAAIVKSLISYDFSKTMTFETLCSLIPYMKPQRVQTALQSLQAPYGVISQGYLYRIMGWKWENPLTGEKVELEVEELK